MEGLIVWLFVGDLYSLMSMSLLPLLALISTNQNPVNDDSTSISQIFNFFTTFTATSLELLSEHSLIAPASAVPNANICTLIMLRFLTKDATEVGHRIQSVEKIVQAADKAGLVWDFRKEIGVKEEDVKALRKKALRNSDWKKEVS
jgi:hypothetical protein